MRLRIRIQQLLNVNPNPAEQNLKKIPFEELKKTTKILLVIKKKKNTTNFLSFFSFFLKYFPSGSRSRRENECGSGSTALLKIKKTCLTFWFNIKNSDLQPRFLTSKALSVSLSSPLSASPPVPPPSFGTLWGQKNSYNTVDRESLTCRSFEHFLFMKTYKGILVGTTYVQYRYWFRMCRNSVADPDPHLKSPPGSGSAWTDADLGPDPGGKKA